MSTHIDFDDFFKRNIDYADRDLTNREREDKAKVTANCGTYELAYSQLALTPKEVLDLATQHKEHEEPMVLNIDGENKLFIIRQLGELNHRFVYKLVELK